jgi:hypothetical protein
MSILASILDLRARLGEADRRLQAMMMDLKKDYYGFIYAAVRQGRWVSNQLFLRSDLDGRGRIRRLFWSVKKKAVRRLASGRKVRLSDRLRGPFRASWIYTVALDWRHRATYYGFEDRRSTLNRRRREVVRALRALRMSLTNGWARRATPADRAQAARIVQSSTGELSSDDLTALSGAVAYSRQVGSLETGMGLVVEEYRRAFRGRTDVSFEPALRWNEIDSLRLFWGFPQTVHTREGTRTLTDYIPGRPTDRWMRKLRLPPRARKEVGAFQKRLLPLQARYEKHLAFLAVHRRRVGEVQARVIRLDPPSNLATAVAPATGAALPPAPSGCLPGNRQPSVPPHPSPFGEAL